MAGFKDLPVEVRNMIYQLLVSGRRLSLVHRLKENPSEPVGSNTRTVASILFVSKQIYTESRSVMLNTAQIDATEMIEETITPSTVYFPNLS